MNPTRDYQPVMPSQRRRMPSKRLIAAYILDWIAIIGIAAIGAGLNFVSPHHRAFSLLNLDISYPLIPESITTTTLVLVALVAPAVLIALVVLALVPGRRFSRTANRAQIIRIKLWELEKGLAGLCLSCAVAFFVTQGMKNIFGKPRPDLLARCEPDLDNIAQYVVGGYGQDISARWTMVTSAICKQTDKAILDDGFRSFPSGHSSFSFSGLLYLSLFLCSKFAITIPYLPLTPAETPATNTPQPLAPPPTTHARTSTSGEEPDATHGPTTTLAGPSSTTAHTPLHRTFHLQNAAAAPPNYLLFLVAVPVAVAVYIVSTRFVEYYHFGFDVISGSLIGILSSWFAFRWYHLPLSRGHGWAWGPRSADRAFAIGVGTGGYVGHEGWSGEGREAEMAMAEEANGGRERDLEAGKP